MAQHRYRHHKVKREHTIIEGLLPLFISIGELEEVRSIIPGRINQRSRTGEGGLFFQYETETGLKLLGRSKLAVQEVFVVTDQPENVLDALISRGIVISAGNGDGHSKRQEKEPSPRANNGRSRRARKRSRPSASTPNHNQENSAAKPSPVRDAQNGNNNQANSEGKQKGGAAPTKSAPPNQAESLEPKLWNELLKLHDELLRLEEELGEGLRSPETD